MQVIIHSELKRRTDRADRVSGVMNDTTVEVYTLLIIFIILHACKESNFTFHTVNLMF